LQFGFESSKKQLITFVHFFTGIAWPLHIWFQKMQSVSQLSLVITAASSFSVPSR